jgi:hypothetical protein
MADMAKDHGLPLDECWARAARESDANASGAQLVKVRDRELWQDIAPKC